MSPRRATRRGRLACTVVAAVVALVVAATPAAADPPRPTRYRTVVEQVDAPAGTVTVRVLGGDSFVEVTVAGGHTASVSGYRGEPFLRIAADGTVEEDRSSYTARTSRTRYGSVVADDTTTSSDWRVVARDGSWAWHDHRAHWMSPEPPVGRGPGDQVLEGVIPLVVDDQPAAVHLTTWWVADASLAPASLGALAASIAACAMAYAAWRASRWPATTPLGVALAVTGAAALFVGLATRTGLPAEAGVSPLQWLLPAGAVLGAAGALAAHRRPPRARALLALGAVALIEWAWWRRAVLFEPVLPTALPGWVDRSVTAAVATIAVALLIASLGTKVHTGRPTPAASRTTTTVRS